MIAPMDADRRRQLRAAYEERPSNAGVYAIRNTVTGVAHVAGTVDLGSARNRLEFAKSTGLAGALDLRLRPEITRYGLDAFEFEVLDVLEPKPEATRDEIAADLRALEELWREKLGQAATP